MPVFVAEGVVTAHIIGSIKVARKQEPGFLLHVLSTMYEQWVYFGGQDF
jgi:hypothetical protein